MSDTPSVINPEQSPLALMLYSLKLYTADSLSTGRIPAPNPTCPRPGQMAWLMTAG